MPNSANPYSVHPGVVMVRKWVEDLPAKTGKDLKQWVAFIKKEGPRDEKAARAWLKEKHELGTNTAWWLAERAFDVAARGWDHDPKVYLRQAVEYVDTMFSGKKALPRPIYDSLLTLGLALGDDVRVCPCQTIVPFYRKNVFAQVKPTTQTRVDLGFCLRGEKATPRLIATGGEKKGDRITHRIEIRSVVDIDAEVKRQLKQAYAAAG